MTDLDRLVFEQAVFPPEADQQTGIFPGSRKTSARILVIFSRIFLVDLEDSPPEVDKGEGQIAAVICLWALIFLSKNLFLADGEALL